MPGTAAGCLASHGQILEVADLCKSFGGFEVLRSLSFQAAPGEILGLIGPNGAGKSTLFDVMTGITAPSSGRIHFKGESILGLRPDQIRRKGLARTFQLVRIFPSMTTLENVLVGATYGGNGRGVKAVEEAHGCLERFQLTDVKDTIARDLTYARRKLVEIARAFASRPDLVLLDEPLAGLNPTEAEQVMAAIRSIKETNGVSIIWIEHKIDAIIRSCDRLLVLDRGAKIADGRPEDLAADEMVVEAYIGDSLT